MERKSKNSRKLNKKYTKNKKISFKCTPRNHKNYKNILDNIEKLSQNEIKKKLEKNGIKIKSDNKKLINDMYLLSSLGGIKIKKN